MGKKLDITQVVQTWFRNRWTQGYARWDWNRRLSYQCYSIMTWWNLMRFLKYWEIWGGFWEIWGGFSKFRSPKIKTRRHTTMLSKYEVLTPNNRGERSDWSSRSTNRQNFQEPSKNHCHKIFDSRLNLPKLWLDLSPSSVNRFWWFFFKKSLRFFSLDCACFTPIQVLWENPWICLQHYNSNSHQTFPKMYCIVSGVSAVRP